MRQVEIEFHIIFAFKGVGHQAREDRRTVDDYENKD